MRLALLVLGALLFTAGHADAFPLDHLYDKTDIGQNKIPHTGTSNILIIPVNIGPIPFEPALFEGMQVQFDPDGGVGTFRKRWQDFSRGTYDPVPTLVQPVEYPDSCPFPAALGFTVDNCEIEFGQDNMLVLDLVLNNGVRDGLLNIITRVRDEQNIDLAQFDINGIDGTPDGFFDGVVIVSNLTTGRGVSVPLEALLNETIIDTAVGGGGPMLELAMIAMAPPIEHEFAHMFGFIDLYNGPTVGCLMGDPNFGGLGAFSRQQIEWGETTTVTEYGEVELGTALDSGDILRVGEGPQYMLIENRSGPQHQDYEVIDPGLYIHSIDESALVPGPLHFFDLMKGDLNYPNQTPPYLSIAMPINCSLEITEPNPCAIDQVGEKRVLAHMNGTKYGRGVEIVAIAADGTMTVKFYDPTLPPGTGGGGGGGGETGPAGDDGCGCRTPGGDAAPDARWLALLAVAGLALRRRRRRGADRPKTGRRRSPG